MLQIYIMRPYLYYKYRYFVHNVRSFLWLNVPSTWVIYCLNCVDILSHISIFHNVLKSIFPNSQISAPISLIGYHYIQTANGAVVGSGQPSFTSQRSLYCTASALTLQPVFLFLLAHCQRVMGQHILNKSKKRVEQTLLQCDK